MKFKLCITLLLITFATACLTLIVVLIPILVLPSLSRDRVDYNPRPVMCILREIEIVGDWKKCRVWHSCRQDCSTKSGRTCFRMYVDYRKNSDKSIPSNSTIENENSTWTETGVPLMINPKACGDLPEVDCDEFQKSFSIGETFFCYYSNSGHSRTQTVINYAWAEEIYPAILSVGLPICLFLIVCGISSILCFWYCRGSPGYVNEKIDVETVRRHAFE